MFTLPRRGAQAENLHDMLAQEHQETTVDQGIEALTDGEADKDTTDAVGLTAEGEFAAAVDLAHSQVSGIHKGGRVSGKGRGLGW